jgi:hypothetical protein
MNGLNTSSCGPEVGGQGIGVGLIAAGALP